MIQVERIEIDLSDLYKLKPAKPASEIIESMLRSYKYAQILAMVNIDDTGLTIVKDYNGIAERIFKEEEDDEVAADRAAEELAESLGKDEIIVIMLHDGYETAIAWVVRFE